LHRGVSARIEVSDAQVQVFPLRYTFVIKPPITQLHIDPEDQPVNCLSRITPMEVLVDPNFDMNHPAFKAEWLAEMEKEWEKDWSTL
jgi:hypothetical protein